MKSEHRHELKTNELAQWFANFPQWVKENNKTIMYVAVIMVLVLAAYVYKKYYKTAGLTKNETELTNLTREISTSKLRILQAQAQGFDLSYNLLQPAGKLETLANESSNDQIFALANIKRAEALRMEIHYRPNEVKNEDLAPQIETARQCYNNVLSRPSVSPELLAKAKFGLGLCAEELNQFDQARQIYNEIIENTQFEGTLAVLQAKQRLAVISDYTTRVAFKPAPKPAVQPKTQLPSPPITKPQVQLEGPRVDTPNL